MRKQAVLAIAILGAILTTGIVGDVAAFAVEISPAMDRTTAINWRIKQAPHTVTNAYWSNGGFWQAEEDETMRFLVGDADDDITGELQIGNMTVITNDTMIARDLTLGVWGNVEFSPGLIIKVGNSDVEELNATAYASAERVIWNYLNGTMLSYYGNLTLGDTEYSCIVFEYQQDSTAAGTPQYTKLIYSTSTGVLLYANTSYHFGEPFEPYEFEIEFINIVYAGTMPIPLIALVIVVLVTVVLVVLIATKRSRAT